MGRYSVSQQDSTRQYQFGRVLVLVQTGFDKRISLFYRGLIYQNLLEEVLVSIDPKSLAETTPTLALPSVVGGVGAISAPEIGYTESHLVKYTGLQSLPAAGQLRRINKTNGLAMSKTITNLRFIKAP